MGYIKQASTEKCCLCHADTRHDRDEIFWRWLESASFGYFMFYLCFAFVSGMRLLYIMLQTPCDSKHLKPKANEYRHCNSIPPQNGVIPDKAPSRNIFAFCNSQTSPNYIYAW